MKSAVDGYVLRVDLANKSAQIIATTGEWMGTFGPGVTRGSARSSIGPHGWWIPPQPVWTQTDPPECAVYWVGTAAQGQAS